MKIAVISRTFSKAAGGAESYSVNLVAQMAHRHEMHVFAQHTDQPVQGVYYHPVFCLSPKPRWINQLLFAFLTWKKTRSGFDVVHSHENAWHGQIQTVHVRPTRFNLLQGRTGLRRALRWLKIVLSPRLLTYLWLEGARFKFALGRHVVATSDGLQKDCERAYPHSKPILSVITPGAEAPDNQPSQIDARLRLGLPKTPPLLLFVANDFARKGLDALLQAMQTLNSDVQLVVVGSLTQKAKYSEIADYLGLGERVHFVGPLNEVSLAYCAADCLVHPTLEDSFAMVVLEAMAHGLPVVVSGARYCGISAKLIDGEQAVLLADPRDAKTMAARVSSVLEDRALKRHLNHNGQQFAAQHSWQQTALKYESLYNRAYQETPSRGSNS